ncbi:methyltransferase [Sciscionella sediminilitoris]|uniref:methyltransferase n=1 Tax=Sciscionella sediminilitoris TaxID=1445613 RepID=UPI0004DF3B90|nr:methyltransferase [Sciscionella sp. SE31]
MSAPDLAGESERLQALADPAPGRVLAVLAALWIPDQLRDKEMPTGELAERVGADPDALGRVLSAAAALDVVEGDRLGWRLRPAGLLLCSDTEGSMRAELANHEVFALWTGFEHSVRTGRACYPEVFGAALYERLNTEPGRLRAFHTFAHERAHRVYGPLLGLGVWPETGTFVDLGGGTGGLAEQLLRGRPELRGVVHDYPAVLEVSPLRENAELAERIRFAPGDLLAGDFPDGDSYVLAAVLHNWPDEQAVRILRAVRARCSRETPVLIVDRVLAEPAGARARFNDLLMLASCGGRERNLSAWRELLGAAQLRLCGTHEAAGTDQVVLDCRAR